MDHQSNPQLKLKLESASNCEFEMNGVKVTYHDKSFIFCNLYIYIYEFSDGLLLTFLLTHI